MNAIPSASPRYRGRFAPTPSGPLHFGSLVAALGSYLEARRHRGDWLLRIEDLDPPRVAAGATDSILRSLEAFGFEWDGPVVYQSARGAAYRDALASLLASGAVYPCNCSRKQIGEAASVGAVGPIYPGSCRRSARGEQARHSWRLNTEGGRIGFVDAVQGPVLVDLEAEIGDFVVLRADEVFAYHLALVVDDASAGITHIVRGSDLLVCTAPQILLQQRLGLPTPHYMHLPVAVNTAGHKLSKQTYARAIDAAQAPALLAQALGFLGHSPPAELAMELAALWEWALAHWDPNRIPRLSKAPSPASE